MASMAEDFWNKVVGPIIEAITGKGREDDGVRVLEDSMTLSKKFFDEDLAIEVFMEEFDSDWVLLEMKNQYVIKPKSKIDLKQLEKNSKVRRIL